MALHKPGLLQKTMFIDQNPEYILDGIEFLGNMTYFYKVTESKDLKFCSCKYHIFGVEF